MRYFTMASLAAFMAVSAALYLLGQMEERFFRQVQDEQAEFFTRAQVELSRQQDTSARSNLLEVHEAGHVNLTRLFANVLWDHEFGPFVARAQTISVNHCRAQAATTTPDGGSAQACFAEVGKRIMALPGFAALDARARETMRQSTVFKIKVFDLRGITIYSSEHAQIGEDKAGNKGWQAAADGQAASELTHRDRFSAFEGVIENRDLISTYVPVLETNGTGLRGVFEIYSDVTPFLRQIQTASAKAEALGIANRQRIDQMARENQAKVSANSDWVMAIVAGLLLLLYTALWLLVRNAQRIIDHQVLARQRAIEREENWHRDKMAALATMAASVSHEVGNPLATIAGTAEEIQAARLRGECPECRPELILEQTRRIAQMTRQIAEFASARSERPELVDLNQMVKAVCDFLSFDHRFASLTIDFRPTENLPACNVIPDHLNEVLMNLLQIMGDIHQEVSERGTIVVSTRHAHDRILVRIAHTMPTDGPPSPIDMAADARLESARRRIEGMGGRLDVSRYDIEIALAAP